MRGTVFGDDVRGEDVRGRARGVGAGVLLPRVHADDGGAPNVMYTAATGLVPDIVPEEQTGESNGVLAAMSAAGACASFVYTMVYPDVSTLYFFYTGLLVTCVPITCYCANESSSLEDEEDEERNDESSRWDADVDFSWRELAQSYVISPTRPEQKSFFWLFICRTLYYTGISAQVFLQYLLRDTAVKDDGSGLTGREPQQTVARLSFIAKSAACCARIPPVYSAMPWVDDLSSSSRASASSLCTLCSCACTISPPSCTSEPTTAL